jgi:hypothetical protein
MFKPEPYTLNHEHQSSELYTIDPKSCTLHPKLWKVNAKSKTLNPRPFKSLTLKLEFFFVDALHNILVVMNPYI